MELVVGLAWAGAAEPVVHRLAVVAEPATSGSVLRDELQRLVGVPVRATVAGLPLDSARFGVPPLVEGAVLLLDPGGSEVVPVRQEPEENPGSLPSLRVVSGENAGTVIALRRGRQWLAPHGGPTAAAGPTVPGAVELSMDDSGVRIARSPTPLCAGDRVRCGDSWLELQVPSPAGPAGRLIEWHPSDTEPDADPSRILTVATASSAAPRLGLALGLLPLVIGVVVTVVTGMWFFLLFSALGAIAAVVSWCAASGARRGHRTRVAAALRRDLARCRAAAPPVAVLVRRLQDLDAGAGLSVVPRKSPPGPPVRWICLGHGTRPAAVRVGAGAGGRSPVHPRGPVLVELARLRHLAVLAPLPRRRRILNALALQLLTGPDAVSDLVVDPLTGWHPPADPVVRTVGPGRGGTPEGPCLEVLSPATAASRPTGRHTVRIVAGPIVAVCGNDPAGAVTATLLSGEHTSLTATASGAVAGADPTDGDVTVRLVPDTVSDRVLADALSAWRRARVRSPRARGGLPETLGSHDLFAAPRSIPARWRRNERARALAAPLGISRHGVEHVELGNEHPHLLVAGTTGCGKSEVLRTLVAGWASRYPPERLEFLFIDFKGGSALAPLTGLPHVTTLLTDLAGEDVRRALEFLKAELHRRERLLSTLGVADFHRLLHTAAPSDPLPLRELVVVVDEVRMLCEAFATAGDRLAGIATVGRSLGIHLVLATQRPQGAVPPDVRANVTQSVCLRVRTEQDSADVIGSGAAAVLPAAVAGRGYLDRGHGPPVEFQAAILTRCGGRPRETVQVRLLDRIPSEAARRPPAQWAPHDGAGVVAHQIARVFRASGRGGPAELTPPVPPPLPERAVARALGGLEIDLGPAENSAEHWTGHATWRPVQDGPLLLIGQPRHTRDALLSLLRQTVSRPAAGAALYVLSATPGVERCARDWLDRSLLRGYARSHEPAGLHRILECLTAGAERFHEAPRPTRDAAPAVVAVEDWDRWCAVLRSSAWAHLEEDLINLLATGEHRGISAVISGDRALSVGRASPVGRTRLYLPADHPPDALLQWPRLPALRAVPGRGVLQGAGAARCSPVPDAASETTMAVTQLPLIARAAGPPRPGTIPHGNLPGGSGGIWPRYAPLPQRWPGPQAPVAGLLMGLGEAHEPLASPWEPGSTLVVAGPARSGRSTFLAAVASRLPGHRVVTAHPGTETDLETALLGGPTGPGDPPTTVIIDDADQLPSPVIRRLAVLWQPGAGTVAGDRSRAPCLVVAVRLGDGLVSAFPPVLQWRHGCEVLLLRPHRPFDAEQFGVSLLGRALGGPAGRGYWIRRGHALLVQAAQPPHEDR